MDDGDDQTGGAIAPDTPGTRMSVASDIDPQEFSNSDGTMVHLLLKSLMYNLLHRVLTSTWETLTEFSLKHVWLTVHLFHTLILWNRAICKIILATVLQRCYH